MAEETPKFCKDFEEKSFSAICDQADKIKPSKMIYDSKNADNLKYKHNNKILRIIKEHEEINNKSKRHNSELLKMKKYNINNIYEFMKKQKFKIRNDYDKTNSEIFLLSKEQAFENPFLYYNNLIEKCS